MGLLVLASFQLFALGHLLTGSHFGDLLADLLQFDMGVKAASLVTSLILAFNQGRRAVSLGVVFIVTCVLERVVQGLVDVAWRGHNRVDGIRFELVGHHIVFGGQGDLLCLIEGPGEVEPRLLIQQHRTG